MKARTRKQGLALAFGKYRYGIARRGEGLGLETKYQRRQNDAKAHDNTICWKCDKERTDTIEKCEHCGADSTPF